MSLRAAAPTQLLGAEQRLSCRGRLRLDERRKVKGMPFFPDDLASQLPLTGGRLLAGGCAVLTAVAFIRKRRHGQPIPRLRAVAPTLAEDRHGAEEGESEGASVFHTFWNLFNIFVGTGVLGLPYVFAKLGAPEALAALIAVASLAWYTGIQLSDLSGAHARNDSSNERSDVSYEDLAEAAFGTWGKRFVALPVYMTLVGVIGIWLVLLGNFFASLGLGGFSQRSRVLIAACAAWPLLFIRDTSGLAGCSRFGVAALLACLVAVLGQLSGSAGGSAAVEAAEAVIATTVSEKLACIGILILTFACHATFPSMRAEMKKPEQFGQALTGTFVSAGVLNGLFSLAVLSAFGASRMPDMVLDVLSAGCLRTFCVGLLATNTILRLPLPTLAAGLPLERFGLSYIMARTMVLAASTTLAIGVPGFAKLMGLVGLLAGSVLAFCWPPLLELRLRSAGLHPARKAFNCCSIVLGAVLGLSGLVIA